MKTTKQDLFIGEYRHSLTQKNRIALPKKIRAEIEGSEVILIAGFEPCITGFDQQKWDQMISQPLEIPFYEDQGRKLRRQIFATATVVNLDHQGRIILPESHLKWANLKGKVGEEVVIIGAGDHFEIWDKDIWTKTLTK